VKVINKFSGEYAFLSNFYACDVLCDGILYPSAEAAYQAAKTNDRNDKLLIAQMTPGQAKRYGRKVKMREGWDDDRLTVMEEILRIKFSDNTLMSLLVLTSARDLIEGNNWGDRFWGVCRGEGQNHLGKILMKIRREAGGSLFQPEHARDTN
jgi:N-glycosidase YbiA